MGVQKSRVSRSRRGMRRLHDQLRSPALSVDRETGEVHLRHHVSKNGYYKGKRVVPLPLMIAKKEGEDNQD